MKQSACTHPYQERSTADFLEILESRVSPPPQVYAGKRTAAAGTQKRFPSDIPVDITDVNLPIGPMGNLFVRIVRPKGSVEKLPAVFYIHGNGWISGNFISHDRLIRTLASCTNSVVIFPSYSLSHQSKFPTALDECFEALRYFYDNAGLYNIKPNKIALAGDCAGANMATVLTIKAKQNNGPRISFQSLFYPITNTTLKGKSMKDSALGPCLTREELECYREMCLEKIENRNNDFVSPFMAATEELKGLPPALIITDENNPQFVTATKHADAGVDVVGIRYKGTLHGFMVLNGLKESPPAEQATMQACSILKSVLHGNFI